MKKLSVAILILVSVAFLSYVFNPRCKFFVQFGIWLPPTCYNFEFTEPPDAEALLGMDGVGAKATFNRKLTDASEFIEHCEPQSIWVKSLDSAELISDTTLQYPCFLPVDFYFGKLKLMLWSTKTKGDFYNIWIIPEENCEALVTISMPFT
jgi:hypothetical protein